MNNITPEQYEKYVKILDYDYKIIDIRILINKYIIALHDYYDNDVKNIDKLNLIIDAFCYFSDFDLCFDVNNLVTTGIDLLQNNTSNHEYSDAQVITALVFEITRKIINKKEEENELNKKTEILYKLASTIYPIQQYEKENGNIKTLMK